MSSATRASGHVDITVLIPVRNEELNLRRAAEGMLNQDFDGTIEFLFIEGRSHDGTLRILHDLAARDARIRILDNPSATTPHGLNVGLRNARGEFVARMDAHTLYPPRYLAVGVSRLRAGGAQWVSGPQLAVGAGPGSRRVALALSSSLGTGGARFRRNLEFEHEVDTGFTGVWHRATLESHSGWDEDWLNDQDFELAARIRRDGGRIVCIPEMAASYIPRERLRDLARQYGRYGVYRVKTIRRHPESMRRSHVLPPAIVVLAGAALLGRGRVSRAAGAGLAVYGVVLAGAAGRAALRARPRDALALPAVYATMHVSYGVGFLAGCCRYGAPLAGIAQLLRPPRGRS
jgi:succinoglycan biosynthesis protein ExoA